MMATSEYELGVSRLCDGIIGDFFVNEGPFRTSAKELIRYSDYVGLQVKWPPLTGGPHDPRLKLRFFRSSHMFYSVTLGRMVISSNYAVAQGSRLMRSEYLSPKATDVMSWWKRVEEGKQKSLKENFVVLPIRVMVDNTTTIVYEFEQMDELEILQKLNARRKNKPVSIEPVSKAPITMKQVA
jgi:hypothetical protein